MLSVGRLVKSWHEFREAVRLSRRKRQTRYRPSLETLEDRSVPSTLPVTNLNPPIIDHGPIISQGPVIGQPPLSPIGPIKIPIEKGPIVGQPPFGPIEPLPPILPSPLPPIHLPLLPTPTPPQGGTAEWTQGPAQIATYINGHLCLMYTNLETGASVLGYTKVVDGQLDLFLPNGQYLGEVVPW